MILRKPAQWNIGPAYCDPRFQSLWNSAIVYPLWEGGGKIITCYPNLRQNLGTGTFPVWVGQNYLTFTAATPHFIDLSLSLMVARRYTSAGLSTRKDHTLGAVFRTTSTLPCTIYGEGDASDNDDACLLQVRGDQPEHYLRYFYRTGDQSGAVFGLKTDGSGVDYADGQWHTLCAASGDVLAGSGTTHPEGTVAFVDGTELLDVAAQNLPYSGAGSGTDQLSIGRSPRAGGNEEEMDGDIALVVTWKRSLTPVEARLWSLDPFGMLRPVLRVAGRTWTPAKVFIAEGAVTIFRTFTGTLTSAGAQNPIEQVQVAKPTSDVDLGPWSGSYTDIDDPVGTPDFADFVATAAAGEAQFGLSSVSDPADNVRHRIFYSIDVQAGTHNLTFRLREGATQRASWTRNSVTGPIVQGMYELTTGEADSVTNYSALRVTVEKT